MGRICFFNKEKILFILMFFVDGWIVNSKCFCFFHQLDLDPLEERESPPGNLKIVHFGVV